MQPYAVSQPVNVNVVTQSNAPSFFVRALWFLFVGWWFGAFVVVAGYVATATVFLLPLGFWCFNRVGSAMTLRPRTARWVQRQDGMGTSIEQHKARQHPWYLRALWFPLGLILGVAWVLIAYVLCALLVTLPIGVAMFDRLPAVITLERN
jgi:uncharacterized membrane protein YccF (DUF307 family)